MGLQVLMDFMQKNVGIYDILVFSMGIQPKLDPDAGFGALQLVMMLEQLDLETEQLEQLEMFTGASSARTYLLVRAYGLEPEGKERLLATLAGPPATDALYYDCIDALRASLPNFNADYAGLLVGIN